MYACTYGCVCTRHPYLLGVKGPEVAEPALGGAAVAAEDVEQPPERHRRVRVPAPASVCIESILNVAYILCANRCPITITKYIEYAIKYI